LVVIGVLNRTLLLPRLGHKPGPHPAWHLAFLRRSSRHRSPHPRTARGLCVRQHPCACFRGEPPLSGGHPLCL